MEPTAPDHNLSAPLPLASDALPRDNTVKAPLLRAKKAFRAGIWATTLSIVVGFGFKIWLAQWVARADLALFHSAVDVISLSLLLLTGFRSSMVVSYSQTKNDRDIINIFRLALVMMVLLTWGAVLPYLKHNLGMDVDYIYLVGVILGLSLKVYFGNQVAMYRLYDATNRSTWLDPLGQAVVFLICWGIFDMAPMPALFCGVAISSLALSIHLWLSRQRQVKAPPLAGVQLDDNMRAFVRKSFIASMEAGASILMIYLMVLLTVRFFSVEELADFQVVIRPVFTYMTLLFVFPIYRFVLPELAVCLREGSVEAVRELRRWVIMLSFKVSGVFALVTLVFGREIVAFVFPAAYANSALVLMHLSLFFVFIMLNAYQLAYIKARGKFAWSLGIRLVGIAALLLSFTLLQYFTQHIVSIILALGSAYLAMYVLSSIAERRLLSQA